ncbi:hypothetical protein J1N35_011967 [Gossypium stocksii]|uniref:Retrotransposon gag domain-containing protein n=1 Tax=Gossypium stocksii TaxID=47602 RepID=A0A9D3W392_9ROSI|nr:hypothetical protein J1N35_011967 [Gossypium stocksii]
MRQPRERRECVQVDDNLSNIKLNIHLFQERNNPKAYLEWEQKIKMIFDCYNYFEFKKVLARLNREIANIVELQHYVEINDMVHMAIKVEQQLKMTGTTKVGLSPGLFHHGIQGGKKILMFQLPKINLML